MSTATIHLPPQAPPVERTRSPGGPAGSRGVEAADWDDVTSNPCDLYGIPGLCGPTYPGRPGLL